MELFQYELLHTLNESEFSVYNYVTKHLERTREMNIRELSGESGMSTTTILRFCRKMGFSGFTELKYKIGKLLEEQKEQEGSRFFLSSLAPAVHFLNKSIHSKEMEDALETACRMCREAVKVLFLGVGTSGNLCDFGARILAGVGISTMAITDPFYPPPVNNMEDTVLIILSVSGETPEIIFQADNYKKRKARIISITNTNHSTVARLSDLNFAYYMPFAFSLPEVGKINLTTQLPVVYILESLMRLLYMEY